MNVKLMEAEPKIISPDTADRLVGIVTMNDNYIYKPSTWAFLGEKNKYIKNLQGLYEIETDNYYAILNHGIINSPLHNLKCSHISLTIKPSGKQIETIGGLGNFGSDDYLMVDRYLEKAILECQTLHHQVTKERKVL